MSTNNKDFKPKKKGFGKKLKSSSIKEFLQKFNKRFVSSIIIFALGISLIPTGIILGTNSESYSNSQIVEQQFPKVLLTVKGDLEQHFYSLIEEMESDPLNGLLIGKLPSPEDIFFEEWANDRFPSVDIPTIGGYIEYVGSKAVGDINLDNNLPIPDLNITSNENPSGITIEQCRSLWDSRNSNSLVYQSSTNWFKAVQGILNNRENIMNEFNLTEEQLNLICNWINTSRNTWLPYLALEERLILEPLPFFVFLGVGALLLIYSTPKVVAETRKKINEKKSIGTGKLKTKPQKPEKNKIE